MQTFSLPFLWNRGVNLVSMISHCKNLALVSVQFGQRPRLNVRGHMWGISLILNWIGCIQGCNLICCVVSRMIYWLCEFDQADLWCVAQLTLSVYISVFASVFMILPLPQLLPTRGTPWGGGGFFCSCLGVHRKIVWVAKLKITFWVQIQPLD